MSPLILLRMTAYMFTIVLHICNIISMANNIEEDVMDEPGLQIYTGLQARFLTCWTFFNQILYAVIALTTDILVLKNDNNNSYSLPKRLRRLRDTLYAAILWPSVWLVFTFFWSLFLYDRDLILPEVIDKVLTRSSNHIIHTAIVPILLLELLCRPRHTPRSHKPNLIHTTVYFAAYVATMFYTYYERKVWVYPIFAMLYGTIYFPLLYLTLTVLIICFYYMQWPLSRLVWGETEMGKRKIR